LALISTIFKFPSDFLICQLKCDNSKDISISASYANLKSVILNSSLRLSSCSIIGSGGRYFLHFQDLVPKVKVLIGHWSHVLVQRKSTGVGNVLLDSYDESLETLIVLNFSEHLDSWILVDSLIWIVEDVMIHQESSWILPGVRNVLLASLDDMQKTW
jgi:hypothetical protein